MRRIRLLAAISAGLALAAGAVAPLPAVASAPSGEVTADSTAGSAETVRLITGDRVTVTRTPDGRQAASVTPGPGRRGLLFRTLEQDGHVTVLPSDADPLVAAGRLDRDLFDVTALLAQRYDTAHIDALPLIIEQDGDVAASALEGLTDLAQDSSVRRLDSIDARALRVEDDDLGRFWKELVAPGGQRATPAGTPRVWLDGRVSASLERSTAQIGARDVWSAGYRGDGVKVAVLDTGADQTHPDLAGRVTAAKDFTGSSGTGDVFGHGTHVASIVGGTGAASGGTRQGVAPAAQLLVGKVLGDEGFGTESQVVAGMEWAVAQGADVVNMSLGSSEATDGTDPMSQALNDLSRRTETLFVVAAGNEGERGPGTVGSPGAADAALTVGAVDRDDALAPFSSRGPRPGDDAVKPDVTAPGVGIVAARAAGSTMGEPVDERYVAASGTSMATPHVAGAAALLAQRHPEWTGADIKDALISTAVTADGQKVTEQGGGRIDARAATLGAVTATGTLAPGPFTSEATTPDVSTLHYTNSSDTDVTLSLAVDLATEGGRKPAEGSVRLGSDSVRVKAGSTSEVPLTVDPARTGRGKFYGYVTARSASGAVVAHTTVSVVVHGPTHRITVRTLGKDGEQVRDLPTIWGAEGFVGYTDPATAVAEVEEGVYQLNTSWTDPADDGQELRHVVLPEVRVTKDMTVTLDSRTAVPVEIRTPRPAEQRGIVSYQTYREIEGRSLTQGTMYFDSAKRIYVSPTARVTEGSFEFASRWQLVAPLIQAKVDRTKADLGASYMSASPLLPDSGISLRAVDAGNADDADFSHARGRVAVVDNPTGASEKALVERAAAAGVRAVLVVHFRDDGWTRWSPKGDRWALPTVRIGKAAGHELLARIARGSTKVNFSGTARSPYLYDVMQVSEQQVPRRVVHTVSARNSAVVPTTYADNGVSGWASEQRFGWRPYQRTAWLQYSRFAPLGFARTEYVSANGTAWQHRVHHTTTFNVDEPLVVGMRDDPRTYRAGVHPRESWQSAVVRPSIPVGTTTPTVRQGDVMRLRVPEFTDARPGHWSRAAASGDGIGMSGEVPSGDTVSAALYRDGIKVDGVGSAWQDVSVPGGHARYRLDLSTSRGSADWTTGVSTTTSWAFSSGRTEAATPMPLLQLDYDVPVDVRNTVRDTRVHRLGVQVRAQEGLPVPRGVSVRVEASYDDGLTWTEARATDHGRNAFRATLVTPARGQTWVALRVTASDDAGNSVRQTVHRAYSVLR
ncbi:S8 family serine peptidase [Streptomyces parvulus]|uniref:Peptidase S8 n=1 Tax=Streptomyces parvulus TaxID=146923 RepID=A0A369UZU4_9ACTN|nr:S8 family serine peptidase [Streptomyces parvulus]RDD85308.1 peptidase S8 [Streptomyces parvulus]